MVVSTTEMVLNLLRNIFFFLKTNFLDKVTIHFSKSIFKSVHADACLFGACDYGCFQLLLEKHKFPFFSKFAIFFENGDDTDIIQNNYNSIPRLF